MLRPTVIKVKPETDYNISVDFDNGEKKVFDVVRPDGQDVCPDELYELGTPV